MAQNSHVGEVIGSTITYSVASPAELPADTATVTAALDITKAKNRQLGLAISSRDLGTAEYLTIKPQGSYDKSTWYYIKNCYDADFLNPSDLQLQFSAGADTTDPHFAWFTALNSGEPQLIPFPYVRLELTPTGGSPGDDAAITFAMVAI